MEPCRRGGVSPMNLSVEGRPLDESSLVDRAKNGDTSAYTELVRAHQDVAFRVAYLVLRDRCRGRRRHPGGVDEGVPGTWSVPESGSTSGPGSFESSATRPSIAAAAPDVGPGWP